MLPRVRQAWIKDFRTKAKDPDQRLQLAVNILNVGSPFAQRKNWDTINSFVAADLVGKITLVDIAKRDNWVTIIESFQFKYANPTNSAVIDAYVAQPLLARQEEWVFPRFVFNENLDGDFGAQKLLNGPYVIVRENSAKLILNPNGSSTDAAPALFEVRTRFVVRYEEQWIMEELGLVEPDSFPDKGNPVLGGK
jgi:hypothetical protein